MAKKKQIGMASKIIVGTSEKDLEEKLNEFRRQFHATPEQPGGWYNYILPMGGLRVHVDYPILVDDVPVTIPKV